ncbi:MAG: hypothetical protein ACI4M3_03395, partial [Acutalibacteraceae bacterium]
KTVNNLKNLMPKNKVFSAALMFEGIKQTKALGICAFIITLITSCGRPFLSIIQNEDIGFGIGLEGFAMNIFILWMIFPIFLVISLFRFMNRRDASDFYHAIPLNRTCVYTSYSAAVAFWGIVSVVLSSIISYILYMIAGKGYFYIPFDFIEKTIIAVLIAALLSMSITLLAKGLSGTEFANIIITGLIMFAPRIFIQLFSETTASSAYIIPVSTLEFANPTLNILLVLFSSNNYGTFSEVITRPSTLIYSLILAIIYYILGLVAHKFRKSETAGESASYRGVQIAVRSTIGFIPLISVCCKIIQYGFSSITIGYLLGTITISLFLYFLYELVATKSGKKLIVAIPMYLIVVGLSCAFVFGSVILRNSMLNDVPAISEIESVSISSYTGYSTYNNSQSQNHKFRDIDVIKVFRNALAENVDYIEKNNSIDYIYENNYERHMIVFHTTSGKDIERTIYIDKSEMDIVLSCISKDKDYLKKVTALPKDIQGIGFSSYIDSIKEGSFDDFEAWHIYEQEYSALTDEQKLKVLRYDLENKIEIGTFYIYAYINNDTLNLCLPLTKEWFPKTYEFLIEKSS